MCVCVPVPVGCAEGGPLPWKLPRPRGSSCEQLCLCSQMDLLPFINKAGCECLNESDEHGFENCLRKDSSYLESDCDEQVRPRRSRGLLGFMWIFYCRRSGTGWEGVRKTGIQSLLWCYHFPHREFLIRWDVNGQNVWNRGK